MKKSFKWRVFISFGLFLVFILILLSGIILYISPPGRIANWTDWRLMGLTKTGWRHQHIIFGFAFALLSLFHLFFINWKVFLSYLKTRASQGLQSPLELVSGIIITLLLGFGTSLHLQPFSGIIDFGENISASWERRENQAPVPHAELMSLVELSRQPGLGGDPGVLRNKLLKADIKVVSTDQTLAVIARLNGLTAERVYAIISPPVNTGRKLPEEGFEQMTLQQVADEAGVTPFSILMALRQKGIAADPAETTGSIARRNGMQLKELRQLLESMLRR
jgi:hypothetical protein